MYEYTKPRGPIAALYGSPGPAYQLPTLCGNKQHDPRSVHEKAPAWLFGTKHGKMYADCSPGPVHYPDVKVTKNGADGTPQFSLYGRPRDPKLFSAPGPGAYHPEMAGPGAQPTAPKYSFGSRSVLRKTDNNPSPNTYLLPSLLGRTIEGNKHQAPIFSQRGRSNTGSFHEDLKKTPGPGTYHTTNPDCYSNKRKAPAYSMSARVEMPGDTTLKPGPGAHSPEKVTVNRRSGPNFSFGIRHSNYTAPLIIEVDD